MHHVEIASGDLQDGHDGRLHQAAAAAAAVFFILAGS
jgi:hypothetical protein